MTQTVFLAIQSDSNYDSSDQVMAVFATEPVAKQYADASNEGADSSFDPMIDIYPMEVLTECPEIAVVYSLYGSLRLLGLSPDGANIPRHTRRGPALRDTHKDADSLFAAVTSSDPRPHRNVYEKGTPVCPFEFPAPAVTVVRTGDDMFAIHGTDKAAVVAEYKRVVREACVAITGADRA